MRTLTVDIVADHGNVAEIIVIDNETSSKATFYVGGDNTTDEVAKKIGYELISWAEWEIEKVMRE